ncbi:hypothetical protein NPIL_333911 [Nephila pilipes]|uniref:Uncharacterized protein n=1 Tax=Nephila pilipes TaxID=299642 RepID=A0A8X6NQV0_NEPPI|nr:hypothetical protein NPIL_333911 [Nephila pilipes]
MIKDTESPPSFWTGQMKAKSTKKKGEISPLITNRQATASQRMVTGRPSTLFVRTEKNSQNDRDDEARFISVWTRCAEIGRVSFR